MAVEYMTSVNISTYDPIIRNISFEYDSGDVSGAGNGNAVIIPNNISKVSITLYISSGEGKVQTTTNKLADVISGTGLVWVDWDSG